jgi:LysR family transcriptional regulator, low CO2-responsive transcriptional regulator
MNYTLNQLRIFKKVVEYQSITKAAEILHLTQPAVSIQLRNLQQQFTLPLTEVINKRIHITDFGREVALIIEDILNQVETINQKAADFEGKLTGSLKISVVSTGKYVIPYYLTDYLRKYPNVDLELDVTNRSHILRNLEKNEVDFSLMSHLPENLNLEKITLLPNNYYLIGHPNHPMHRNWESGNPTECPVIFRESGSSTRLLMEKFLKEANLRFEKKMELTSNEAVKQAVIAGLGFSVMSVIGLKNELKNGDVSIIPYPGLPLRKSWHLVWLKEKKLSPAASGFVEHLSKEKEKIKDKHFRWIAKYE